MAAGLKSDTTLLYRRIVEAAVLAPSAENVQPWRFSAEDTCLTVYLDRQKTFESDVDSMLTLTGLGTCVENAVIAAREFGWEARVSLLDFDRHSGTERFVPLANLIFSEATNSDPLYRYLRVRCTCRRFDSVEPLASAALSQLHNSVQAFPNVRITWLTERSHLTEAAALISQGNRIRFEHEPFHGELYHNLRFTPAEAQQTRDGLDVATLQLPPGVATAMWLLRKWPRMRLANRLGFSRGVARQASQEVLASSAIGVLTVDDASPQEFLDGGRAFERIWLTATSLGLALHPTASLPVFLAHAQRTDLRQLQPQHATAARDMLQRFYRLCPMLRGRAVQMMFRIGRGPLPKTRSLRRPADDVLEFK